MADIKFLPVDALARQQLNKRALTAHSNFIVDNEVFTMSSNRPKGNYDELNLFPPFRMNFVRDVRAECSGGADESESSSSCTSRTRPDQHVRVTCCLKAWSCK